MGRPRAAIVALERLTDVRRQGTSSKGSIYTGEVFNGERVQRFVPVS
jgi:hypothetical protein